MSIIDINGNPIAHDFNSIDGAQLLKSKPKDYIEISDEEFEKRFPELFKDYVKRTRNK